MSITKALVDKQSPTVYFQDKLTFDYTPADLIKIASLIPNLLHVYTVKRFCKEH